MRSGFLVLGDVQAWDGDVRLRIGPRQRQLVLAALLWDAERVVPIRVLTQRIWGHPDSDIAHTSLRAHISRLRTVLDQSSWGVPGGVLVHDTGGYRLLVPSDRVDLHRFRQLTGRALDLPPEPAVERERARILTTALGLWRGELLAGLGGTWVETVRTRMRREFEEARLVWAWSKLRLGAPEPVLAALDRPGVDCTATESLARARMTALAMTGRTEDALDCYHRLRHRVLSELGVDPSPELTDLYTEIRTGRFTADRHPVPVTRPASVNPRRAGGPGSVTVACPADRTPGPDRALPGPRLPPPAQLPNPVAAFTGRRDELAGMDALSTEPGETPIVLITGTAGVGKTALAVHWAHRARGRFPDGQLFTDLRGYDPEHPADPQSVLAGFLRALGLDGAEIPSEPEERVVRYRSLIRGRRLLVVIDNARDAEQVRPFLPDSPTCTVLVTSRDTMPGLLADDSVRRVPLGLLPVDDAERLVTDLIGQDAGSDPHAVQAVVQRCARLPLALRIAAERAAELAVSRSGASLAALAEELADEDTRLDVLGVTGDPRSAPIAVFSWSCRHLDDETALVFRMLGLHPGPDVTPHAMAAMTGTSVEAARTSLDRLTRVSLAEPTAPDRYGMHDLLRDYARGLATTNDTPDRRSRALTRLLDYQFAACAVVTTLLPAQTTPPRVPAPAVDVPLPAPGDAAAARAWLDAERPGLVRSIVHAAENGFPHHAVALVETLWLYLYYGNHLDEGSTASVSALRAARACGDRTGESIALMNMAGVLFSRGRTAESADHMGRALDTIREGDAPETEARILINLGVVERYSGKLSEAVAHTTQALDLWRSTGNLVGQTHALSQLGHFLLNSGDRPRAEEYLLSALAVAIESGDLRSIGDAHEVLSEVFVTADRLELAAEHCERALSCMEESGSLLEQRSPTLVRLGGLRLRQGLHEQAQAHFDEALAAFDGVTNRVYLVSALNGLGEVYRVTGDHRQALDHFVRALVIAEETETVSEQIVAHQGLVALHRDTGDSASADRHAARARELGDSIATAETPRAGR